MTGAETYTVTTLGYQLLPKYFRGCRESRREALLQYRVQIPCRCFRLQEMETAVSSTLTAATFRGGVQRVVTVSTLYLNPEWDFLQFTSFSSRVILLPQFLHHLKTRFDPRKFGLLNVVMTRQSSGGYGIFNLDPSVLSHDVRRTIKETLGQLAEVFFYASSFLGRVNLGYIYGNIFGETWFNCSMPIQAETPLFEQLFTDPRPISNDLQR